VIRPAPIAAARRSGPEFVIVDPQLGRMKR
jgi:hypothetical protein